MWLPGPIYESLPYFCVLGGVLFISGTLYIGLSADGAPLYIGMGLLSIVYGMAVFVRRQTARRGSAKQHYSENVEQAG